MENVPNPHALFVNRDSGSPIEVYRMVALQDDNNILGYMTISGNKHRGKIAYAVREPYGWWKPHQLVLTGMTNMQADNMAFTTGMRNTHTVQLDTGTQRRN